MERKSILRIIASLAVLTAIMPVTLATRIRDDDLVNRIMDQGSLNRQIKTQAESLPAKNISSNTNFDITPDTVAVVTTGNLAGTIVIVESVNDYDKTAQVWALQGFDVNTQKMMHVGDTIDLGEGTLVLLDAESNIATFSISPTYASQVRVKTMLSERSTVSDQTTA